MAPLPRVAVVVPILNEAAYIRAAMESLLAQDGIQLEVTVIDGGSTDGTLDILHSLPVALQVAPGLGQMAAINRGWQATSAEFVTWMAGDDRYKPGALQRLASGLQEHPAAAVAHAQAHVIDEHDRVVAHLAPGSVGLRDLIFEFSLVPQDRKSTRLNSSHSQISYAVFCLK